MNNEAIWAEISSQEQSNNLLEEWSNPDYLQDMPGPSKINEAQLSAQELTDSVDDPKFVYSKVQLILLITKV